MLYLSFQDEDFDKVRRKEIDKSKKLSPADNNHLAPPAGHRVSHDSTSLQQQQHHLIHKSCRNYRVVKAWRSEQVETLQWQSRSERVTSHWLQRHRRAACLPFRATPAAFLGEWPLPSIRFRMRDATSARASVQVFGFSTCFIAVQVCFFSWNWKRSTGTYIYMEVVDKNTYTFLYFLQHDDVNLAQL